MVINKKRFPSGIRLTLYSEGREVDTFVLDKEAKGGITGSRISNDLEAEQQKDDFRVRRHRDDIVDQNGTEIFPAQPQL